MKFTQTWNAFFNRTVPNVVLRIVVMFVGASCVAASVGLTRATGLGTSPISCFPTALSYITPFSIGVWTFVLNFAFVLGQIALLRREFNPVQLLQLPYVFVFSALIDLFVYLFNFLPMPNYPAQLLWSVVGCFLTAIGVFLQVKTRFLTLPGEGISLAISHVFKIDYPKVKIGFDTTNVVVAAVTSLVFAGGLFGVREGTVLSALTVGAIVGLYNRAMPNFETFCPVQGHIVLTAAGVTADEDEPAQPQGEDAPLVVTIGRQYGSGGREIGQLVGKELGIPVFDHTLIDLAAKEGGLTREFVAAHDQEVRHGLLYNLYMQSGNEYGADPNQMDPIWLAQAHAITKLASAGSCVIVGRCANFILEGRSNVFDVFVHAPAQPRVARVMKREVISAEEAERRIERIDRERAEHCQMFAGKQWGAASTTSCAWILL